MGVDSTHSIMLTGLALILRTATVDLTTVLSQRDCGVARSHTTSMRAADGRISIFR